ncbi:Borealin N terminal-domain-containing protein [Apiospora aurea]|uniref:Borealin N terminal-domain-containing protein n=1 Tax=Apiospora aurea TaxID=335848 RepID=A0ABR1QCZ9_9PEZI
MAPVQPRKRKSSTPTSTPQRSPIKRRKVGLSLAQKQALIDNLQLEITERARRLRAQYNVQAQQLRSRVEMRVNRIPTSLRKAKMGELFAKHSEPQPSRAARSQYVTRPPPVPAKDGTLPKPIPRKPVSANEAHARRPHNPVSDDMASVYDKENSAEPIAIPKKKSRAGLVAAEASVQPSHVLSPTSTNARVAPRATERPTSPVKSGIGRPPSPSKNITSKPSSNILSSMVEKAKGSRAAAASRKAAAPPTSGGAASSSTRSRKPPLPVAATTASTRGRRKVSGASESSESSTSTVVKKSTASRADATKPPPPAKRTVMGTIKSATSKKAPASKATAAPASTTGTGRTLRKRA